MSQQAREAAHRIVAEVFGSPAAPTGATETSARPAGSDASPEPTAGTDDAPGQDQPAARRARELVAGVFDPQAGAETPAEAASAPTPAPAAIAASDPAAASAPPAELSAAQARARALVEEAAAALEERRTEGDARGAAARDDATVTEPDAPPADDVGSDADAPPTDAAVTEPDAPPADDAGSDADATPADDAETDTDAPPADDAEIDADVPPAVDAEIDADATPADAAVPEPDALPTPDEPLDTPADPVERPPATAAPTGAADEAPQLFAPRPTETDAEDHLFATIPSPRPPAPADHDDLPASLEEDVEGPPPPPAHEVFVPAPPVPPTPAAAPPRSDLAARMVSEVIEERAHTGAAVAAGRSPAVDEQPTEAFDDEPSAGVLRWLLATAVGAVILAFLLPLTVAAIRDLMGVS